MPMCHIGKHSVPAEDLRRVGDALACSACRKLRGVEGDVPVAENNGLGEKIKKSVLFVNISEIDRTLPDGRGTIVKDHRVEVQVGLGSLNLKWDVTFDEIRDFFTKRREKVSK